MGLEALVRALERDVDAETTALQVAAEQAAEAIRREGLAHEAAERARCRREVEADHAAGAAERLATASRGARLRVLDAERAWLREVHDEVERELAALPLDHWRSAIPVLVGTALRYAGSAPVTLTCPPEAEDEVWALAGARLETTVRGLKGMPPGLVLRGDDGHLTVPLTLHDRLKVRWPDLQLSLLGQVEGGP